MRTLISLALVAMVLTAIVGCKASGEVDTDANTSISMPR